MEWDGVSCVLLFALYLRVILHFGWGSFLLSAVSFSIWLLYEMLITSAIN